MSSVGAVDASVFAHDHSKWHVDEASAVSVYGGPGVGDDASTMMH
jgi:hypothetical protein